MGAGGDRGLYKTTDGGKTWTPVAQDRRRATGANRRRHRPAQSRRALRHHLPAPPARLDADRRRPRVGDLQVDRRRRDLDEARRAACRTRNWARIGLAISPADPRRGLRDRRGGRRQGRLLPLDATPARPGRSAATTSPGSPQYYHEIVRRPARRRPRLLAWTRCMQVTDDGGKTFSCAGESRTSTSTTTPSGSTRSDTDHLLAGCDGGLYESFDRGATWRFKANLPITQFYKVDGRQRRALLQRLRRHPGQQHAGRPVAHRPTSHGITNADWFVTRGRRRLPAAGRPDRPEHRLRRVAVRRPGALRPAHRRADRHPAAAGTGRGRRSAGTGTRR